MQLNGVIVVKDLFNNSLFIVNEDCGNLTAVNGSLLFNKNFTAVINQRAHRIAVNIYPYIFILF